MKNIIIVFGGTSSEYSVSLQSSYAVINAIDKNKYNRILLGISKAGEWLCFKGNIEKIPSDEWENETDCKKVRWDFSKRMLEIEDDPVTEVKVDLLFPILHGNGGEDGSIQGMCEQFGIPYAGCRIMCSAIGMNKLAAHIMAESIGIRVPEAFLLEDMSQLNKIHYPVHVKPLDGGSSLGITKVKNAEEMSRAIKEAKGYSKEIIIEESIDGYEVGVAVLESKGRVVTGEIDEVVLEDGFFDFEEKYTLKTSKILVPSESIDESLKNIIKDQATRLFKLLGGKGFARIDFFVDQNKEVYFNEINTIPGFTTHSRFPNMLKAAGYSFEEIVETIIEGACANE